VLLARVLHRGRILKISFSFDINVAVIIGLIIKEKIRIDGRTELQTVISTGGL
jgi:hypothetical protein